jgi:hypothetical protein
MFTVPVCRAIDLRTIDRHPLAMPLRPAAERFAIRAQAEATAAIDQITTPVATLTKSEVGGLA